MIAINMEMPSCCTECPLLDGEYGTCNIIGETKVDMTEERAKNCPLAEVITCKDCRHWNFNENSSILCGYCSNFETETNEDFYCMDGERRE